jgi:DNA-binding transcriptional ArsR family regulator
MKMSEEFEKVKRLILEKHTLPAPTWRIKRKQIAAYTRVCILNVLQKAEKPLNLYEIAFETGLTSNMIRNHLRALVAGKIVCDKLIPPEPENMRVNYYTICPKCPLKNDCEYRSQTIWK